MPASSLDDAIARLTRALDAAEESARAQTGPAGAKREVEIMADDRARMAEELNDARTLASAARRASDEAMVAVREARNAVVSTLESDTRESEARAEPADTTREDA